MTEKSNIESTITWEYFQGKSLRDLADEELYYILNLNEDTELVILAGICSEILRRKMEKDRECIPCCD